MIAREITGADASHELDNADTFAYCVKHEPVSLEAVSHAILSLSHSQRACPELPN